MAAKKRTSTGTTGGNLYIPPNQSELVCLPDYEPQYGTWCPCPGRCECSAPHHLTEGRQ
jgi:hypothetical protein